MSIQAVAWALDQQIDDPCQKLILIALANHADHTTGECWPSMKTIAWEASCARRTVLRKLPELESAGYVTILRSIDSDRKRAHTYRLGLRRCDSQSHQMAELDVTASHIKPGFDVTQSHNPCDTGVTTRTITEPSPLTPTPLPPNAGSKGLGDGNRGRCSVQPGTPAFDAWLAFAEKINATQLLKVLNAARSTGSPALMTAPLPPSLRQPARASP